METNIKNKFLIIGCEDADSEKIARAQMTYWEDVWRRLKLNKIAMLSIGILMTIAALTIFGQYINGFAYEAMDTKLLNQAPNGTHWFGTDELGRDMFSRVWKAGRVSIIIGLAGAFVSSILGCIYGGVSAFFGGKVDNIMMRIIEILMSVPYLLVVILISLILDSKGLGTLLLAMCLTGWCGIARMVRGQMLQISSQEYVTAAKALGVSPWNIIRKHLIPNTIGIIIVSITFDIPGYIFAEAFLSYVGLGIQSPNTSWGALASAAQQNLMFFPYQLFFPALMIALTMLSFTLLGDGLRDALDPKLRQ